MGMACDGGVMRVWGFLLFDRKHPGKPIEQAGSHDMDAHTKQEVRRWRVAQIPGWSWE